MSSGIMAGPDLNVTGGERRLHELRAEGTVVARGWGGGGGHMVIKG